MKFLAAVALLPAFGAALSLWFVFSDEVAFAVSIATVLFFVLILLGPANQPR